MFGFKRGLVKDDFFTDLPGDADNPKIIGKPAPTSREIRAILQDVNNKLDLEIECLELNLSRGKALKN